MPEQMPAANRMTLATFKTRLGGAKKGWSLLKKKRDALKAKFQQFLKQIIEAKLGSGTSLKEASFALAKANWASSGDIVSTVIERASKPACTVKMGADNVAGVSLPKFAMVYDDKLDQINSTLGISDGGAVIGMCRKEYLRAVMWLVKLASLQTSFKTLDEEIKMTSRRVNALEFVLIPRIEFIIAYITQEMDEQTREEFFRVKKVVEKKKIKMLKEKADMEALEAAEDAARGQVQRASKPLTPVVQPAPAPVAPVRKVADAAPPPAAAPPPVDVAPAQQGFLARAVNSVERATGVDLDGDGDVGQAGQQVPGGSPGPSPGSQAKQKAKNNKKKKGKDATDQQDEDIVFD